MPDQNKDDNSNAIWNWVVFAFLWMVAMAVWQRGWSGYFWSFLALYVIGAVLVAGFFATRFAARYAVSVASVGFLALWWKVGGTYSWPRDVGVGVGVVALVLASFPESRLWLRRMPTRWRARRRLARWRHIREIDPANVAARAAQFDRLKTGAANFGKRTWNNFRHPPDTVVDAQPVARAPIRRRLSATVVATAALAVWVASSGLDWLLEGKPLPRKGAVLHPASMPAAYGTLHVGLAMSGGGYRAALVHAGVVDALGQLGVPVTHMSSVSGGSIIASYLSVGGDPVAFRDAVAQGRFRMTRDLMAVENLVRLPSPARAPGIDVDLWPFFDHFSRLNVQANLVNRVLLNGSETAGAPSGPALMICMTDLTYGMSVGAIDSGYFFVGPTSKAYFRSPDAIEFPALKRLADRVAVSGAFPGAFPPLEVKARITTAPQALPGSTQASDLNLLLADGGVRDNLGLTLLETADAMARAAPKTTPPGAWTGFTPPADWALDLILVSDGGKFMQSEAGDGVLSSMMRAIDLSGLETGVSRTLRGTSDHPVVVLSALGTVAPGPDAAVLGMPLTAMRDANFQFFRPASLPPDVLDKLIALVPDASAARAALVGYRQLPPGFEARTDRLAQRCQAGAALAASDSADCAWWRLVSLVGADIWDTTQAFIQTPTLSDTFTVEQANAVFRFGQYMALLKAPQIRQALDEAQRKKASSTAAR